MSGFDWFLIAWWLFGVVVSAFTIGKPRKPFEPASFGVLVVINIALIGGLFVTRGVL